MKKPSNHQINHAKNLAIRRQKSEYFRASSRRRKKQLYKLMNLRKISLVIKIIAPKIFRIANKEERVIFFKFIKQIHLALQNKHSIQINFSQTEQLYPCGTLIFVAEMDGLLTSHPAKIKCNYPKNKIVHQLFQHIGLLNRMGLPPRGDITADNVKHWHYVTGHCADTSVFKDLMTTYQNSLDTPIRMGLYDGMTEAVTNCIHHAYADDKSKTPFEKKWWMFAEQRDNRLTIAICDLGIGIVESLKRRPELKDIIPKLRGKLGTQLLGNAVGSSRTSTKLAHRGKGLPEILEFVRGSKIGGLLIHSNYASFAFNASNQIEELKDFPQPLNGTLVQWGLSLADEV